MIKFIKVKYEDKKFPKTFSGRKYLYFTTKELNIGDIVIAPTRFGSRKALVCEIANEIEESSQRQINTILSIMFKLDKEKFLKESKIVIVK